MAKGVAALVLLFLELDIADDIKKYKKDSPKQSRSKVARNDGFKVGFFN